MEKETLTKAQIKAAAKEELRRWQCERNAAKLREIEDLVLAAAEPNSMRWGFEKPTLENTLPKILEIIRRFETYE
ncbi:MAG: hypothetical protein ABSC87_08190 [Halobacteriota archaeon]|jgi:hypothetical protein